MMQRRLLATVAAVALTGAATGAAAQTEVVWWHAMGGELGEKVQEIADGFNAGQDDYVVVPEYKGDYTETMTAAIAAFRAGRQPHIVQVFEVGTATMMAAEGAIYPVHQLMADAGEPFDPEDYLAAVVGYYTTTDGRMLSMPFNSSTPVLYYNKDQFEEAGLDPDSPPETWDEMSAAIDALQESGVECGLTTGWQSWVHLENFSAWHDVPLGTLENGFGGLATELVFDETAAVDHIAMLAEWQESKKFDYGGRRSDALPKFYSGECAFYTGSSASYAGVRANVDFDFGLGMLPYHADIEGAPQNSIIGGATLWPLAGHDEGDYAGVAEFFTHLSSPEVQAEWHQSTGYLPITYAAYELSQSQGFYEENPGTDTSIRQMTLNEPTANSKGLRFGNFVQIRDIINEELEAVWAGDKSADAALDAAVNRGNELLRQFEADNS
ncbi:MAG: sn-glycerol-3-phosphate ABC transporter substrate-binding protein UgpB [Alphaproteobacteria bacterium]